MLLLCALIVGSSAWAENVTLTAGTNGSTCTVNGKDGIKVGTSSKGGDMTITVPANTTKLTLHAAAWKGVSNLSLTISGATTSPTSINLTANDGISNNTPFTLSGNVNESDFKFEITLSNITTETHIKFSSADKRFVVWDADATVSSGDSSPTISATPTSLSGFTYVEGNGLSVAQTISVSGSNLTKGITLSLGENSNYEMCLTENGTYTNSLTLNQSNGSVSATNIYVRLISGLKAGDKNGAITLTSKDASDVTVNLSGSVTTLAVTYDANGGTGTVPADNTGYAYGSTVTVLDNTGDLTKEHYTFGGWNTQADGNGTTYQAGNTFEITENTTLYAKWTLNTHTVTLPAADTYGTYTMNATSPVAYGTEVTLTYTPATGYENYAAKWTVNGTQKSDNKFTMPDEDVTVTVSVEEIVDYATLPFSCEGSKSNLPTGLTQNGLGSDYNTSPKLKFDDTGDYLILKINERPGTLTFDIKGNSFSGGTFKVQTSADGVSYTDFKTYTSLGNTQNEEFNNLGASVRYIKWIYTKKSSGNVGLGNIGLTSYKPVRSITVTPTTVDAPFEGTEGTLSVSYEDIPDLISFDIQFCEANGDELEGDDPDWIIAEVEGDGEKGYTVSYIIDNNNGEARTAYFKVYTTSGNDDVYSNLVTINQARLAATYTLVSNLTPGKKYIIASGTDGSVEAMGAQTNNYRGVVGVTASNKESATTISVDVEGVSEFVVYGPDANGSYTIYDAEEGYLYASSSSDNYLNSQNTNDKNGKWSISFDDTSKAATVVAQGSNSRKNMRYNSSNSRFSCYKDDSSIVDPVYFYEKADAAVSTTVEKTLNSSGYATFATTTALDFLDAEQAGYSAWQITGINGSTITFSQITNHVEAGTGILLKGTPNGNINLNILPVGGSKLTSNLLVGTTADFNINNGEYYGLSGNTFVPVSAGTIPAGKALLPASAVPSGARLTFVFEEANGISAVESVKTMAEGYYNLQGQRIDTPKKGLYIVNGKKVIIK